MLECRDVAAVVQGNRLQQVDECKADDRERRPPTSPASPPNSGRPLAFSADELIESANVRTATPPPRTTAITALSDVFSSMISRGSANSLIPQNLMSWPMSRNRRTITTATGIATSRLNGPVKSDTENPGAPAPATLPGPAGPPMFIISSNSAAVNVELATVFPRLNRRKTPVIRSPSSLRRVSRPLRKASPIWRAISSVALRENIKLVES
ncbi:hypothetical protein ACODNH_13315 [Haloarcula sp. NS06]|uniref:hypothetical protein n=1 Tax=Haloarcula sp. NS06 TaxID=3409688 RepID=UPI003DA701C4